MIKLFDKLKNDPRIRNSLWMLIEKAISLFGLIFIISAVAKYTGPTIYGEIALAASIFVVLKTISQLGLDQIYFKYVSQGKSYHYLFLKNAIKLISIIFIFMSLIIISISYFYASSIGFYFIIASSIAYFFNSIDLLNAYYEGALLSKINVISNVIGLLISLLVRWLIVFFELNYIYICFPIILMTLIPFIIKFMIYFKNFKKFSKERKINDKKYYYYFIYSGIPLMLAIITAIINGQVANFLLGYIENTKSVGIYSIAFMLAGAWCILPTTLIMSYMTSIYNINNSDYESYLALSSKIFKNVFFISLLIVTILFYSAPYLISWLYGGDYFRSIEVFRYLLFFQFIWVINFFFSRIIIKFNGYSFLAKKSIFCCLLNAIACYFLILDFSILGAALALIITEITSLFINFIYRKARLEQLIFTG